MKQYKPWSPLQPSLLPPSPSDWLEDTDLAYMIIDLVEGLDLTEIESAIQGKDHRGQRPFNPRMMLALLFYCYATGIYSSRRIARATYHLIPVRVITGGHHPFHTNIAAFRRRHLKAFERLFVQVLQLCGRAGLINFGLLAIDGTKVHANASKHKAMSFERMQQEELKLSEQIQQLVERAEEMDRQEDATYGPENAATDIPEELKRREDRQRKIAQAEAALKRDAANARADELRQQAENAEAIAREEPETKNGKLAATRAPKRHELADQMQEKARREQANGAGEPTPPNPKGLPEHKVRHTTDGEPKPKAQRNFTDPDSRLMERNGEILQGYNCQAVVDDKVQIIVGQGVSNTGADSHQLSPLLSQVEENCQQLPPVLVGDGGYMTDGNVDACLKAGVLPVLSMNRKRHGPPDKSTDLPPPSPGESSQRALMRKILTTEAGREARRRRKFVVEPVFGQIKEARDFRRFHLRGLEKVTGEWTLICLVHNMLKLFKYG